MLPSVRNFAITFVIAAVIFGLLALLGVNIATAALAPETTGDSETDAGADTNSDVNSNPNNGDTPKNEISCNSFSFVLIGTDYQPDVLSDYTNKTKMLWKERIKSADTIILVRFRKESSEIIVTPIPSQTKVSVDGVTMSLGEAYNYKGGRYIADKVTVLTGITVDYYASVTMSGLKTLIDSVGGIDFDVPQTMNYEDDVQKLMINLNSGNKTLSGDEALQMLRYNGYSDKNARMNLAASFGTALLDKLAVYTNMLKAESLFNTLSPNVETDFTLENLNSSLDLIFSYKNLKLVNIEYPGKFSGDFFEPDQTAAYSSFANYK